MTTPKACRGCNSFSYYCNSYIGSTEAVHRKIYREKFCPCKDCIVKMTCTDPKLSLIQYWTKEKKAGKCKMFNQSIVEYKDYIDRNKITVTRIKRKKRK
jgi:hypothetical protein